MKIIFYFNFFCEKNLFVDLKNYLMKISFLIFLFNFQILKKKKFERYFINFIFKILKKFRKIK